jgi:hypothetical protein
MSIESIELPSLPQRNLLRDQVYETLRDSILGGVLPQCQSYTGARGDSTSSNRGMGGCFERLWLRGRRD